MPTAPLQLCVVPGCPELVAYGRCATHRADTRRAEDARRPSAARRGYGHAWRGIRADYLTDHPLCEGAAHRGAPLWARPAATDVDHRDGLGPAGSNDPSNLEALCHSCHSIKTNAQDGGLGRPRRPSAP